MARQGHFQPQALRTARLAAALTQHELARLVGVAGGERVSRWELGLSTPRPETLARLAEVLGVEITRLSPATADLRSLRLSRGLSMSELARRAHVSKTTVSRWETGQVVRVLPPTTLRLLANTLDVTPAVVREAMRGDG
jgi:transcriptional regulator with XRE-family HTH domain